MKPFVAAALDEFSARGFAATRLEDIAKRAGVGKGTIYLHFADKEKLFEEIVRTMVVPFVTTVESLPPVDLPIRVVLENLIEMFVREVYSTRRRDVLRLVLAEVPRFPALADFYYKAVIERAIGALRGIIGARGGEGGAARRHAAAVSATRGRAGHAGDCLERAVRAPRAARCRRAHARAA